MQLITATKHVVMFYKVKWYMCVDWVKGLKSMQRYIGYETGAALEAKLLHMLSDNQWQQFHKFECKSLQIPCWPSQLRDVLPGQLTLHRLRCRQCAGSRQYV